MDNQTSNPTNIKEKNQRVLARYIFENKETSRSTLVKVFKLSGPSVYKNIGQLIDQNIVIELGEGDSEGGRRPKLVSFNYNYGYLVGIDLKGESIKIVLANLELEIIGRASLSINTFVSEEALLLASVDAVGQLLSANDISPDRVKYITMGYPGSVDQKTGKVNMAPTWLNIKDVKKLESLYMERFKHSKILIKNDTNLAAIGELRYGSGMNNRNLIYVSIDMGVGAGIIIEGKLFEGSRFSTGEIGYSKVSPGSDRSLEDEVSVRGLFRQILNDSTAAESQSVRQFISTDKTTLDYGRINQALSEGNPYLRQLLKNAIVKTGFVLSNICVLLDIDAIIIGGQILEINYDFCNELSGIVHELTPVEVKTVKASLNGDEVIYGGFALALDDILDHIVDH